MSTPDSLPIGSLVVAVSASTGEPAFEPKWRVGGKQVKRRVGPAWLVPDNAGGWVPRRGRVRTGFFDERRATIRMAELIGEHADEMAGKAAADELAANPPVTFREVAADWLLWLAEVKKASESTLRDYQSTLAEPGVKHKRGRGVTKGPMMQTFGDQAAAEITRRQISDYLRELDKTGITARTVNKHRQILSALFNYGMRDDTFSLPSNPVVGTDKRREPPAAALDFFEPNEIELLASVCAGGTHRAPRIGRGGKVMDLGDDEIAMRAIEDAQDAEMIRVLSYCGLRIGECIALKWGDVDLERRRLIVQRAISGNKEGHTKTWQVRYVPLASPALAAFERLSSREDFSQRDDYVFVNRRGGRIDDSAFRRRYHAARQTAGLRHIKLHGLRHGAGSLIARETDPVFVQHFPRPRQARHNGALHAREGPHGGHREDRPRIRRC